MKFIVSSTALLKQLQVAVDVIPSKVVLPILSYFLFEVENGKLTVSATDMEISIKTMMPVESREDGAIAVEAKKLVDLLKSFPEQPLTFSVNLETGLVGISHDTGSYQIQGENSEDFPKFPTVEGASSIMLPANIIAEAMNVTNFGIGTDEIRPAMTGLYTQLFENELRFVSTDGNKLVLYKRTDAKASKEDAFLLPRKVLNTLKLALPNSTQDIEIQYNRLNAHFTINNMVIVCRLIDERFPDYRAAFPLETKSRLKVARLELMGHIRRLNLIASKSTYQIKFSITGSNLRLSAEDLDYANKGEEKMTCEFEGNDMEIGFNGKFLSEMLNAMTSDEVEFHLTEFNRPGIIKPAEQLEGEEIQMLLMPIVVNFN